MFGPQYDYIKDIKGEDEANKWFQQKTHEDLWNQKMINQYRPSFSPEEMVRLAQQSQGIVPGGIASEEGAGIMAPKIPLNDPRYMTEGPETANLQLTPPELARRARLEAEIDRELVDPNFVSQVNQMEKDALDAENQRLLVGSPPSYDPELEQMLTQEQRYLSDTLRGPLGKETWEMPNLQNPMLGSIEHNPQDYAQFGLLEEQPAFIPGPDNISAMEGFDQLNQMNQMNQMNQENYPPGSPELSGGVVAQNNQNTGWAMNDDLRKFMLEQGLNMFNDEGW